MKPVRDHSFSFTRGMNPKTLINHLAKKFIVEERTNQSEQQIFYDTFDWRLHRKKLLFVSSANSLKLQRFDGSELVKAQGRKRSKYFWWDLGQSELSEKLQGIIAMRALCPIVSLSRTTHQFRIMNKDRKTVARLALGSDQAAHGNALKSLPETVYVQEIRGYESSFAKVLKHCSKLGLIPLSRAQRVERFFSASERIPRDYGGKFRVELDDNISIGRAVSKICLNLVDDMERNHEGVCSDIDSEFLHDFRIAVRRTRSLLSLLKKVLPLDTTTYFQTEFRWLGSVTGPVRDTDVCLLEKDDYLGLLPDQLQKGMNLFFDELLANRIHELKLLRQHLTSQRYLNLLSKWRSFLSDPESKLFRGIRTRKCKELADTLILKRYENFVKEGDKITEFSADTALHQLRIKGKKLRYLLEFFKSFYDVTEMNRFLKYMKKLQDNLGDFNDLSVQQEILGEKLDSLKAKNLQTIRFASALGGLISVLADKQKCIREEFESTYAQFSRDEVNELIQAMVAGAGKSSGAERK